MAVEFNAPKPAKDALRSAIAALFAECEQQEGMVYEVHHDTIQAIRDAMYL